MRRTMLLFLTGLFLICMCGLMLQIMETRLLSVMAWYYLAFFAISMAMFGMTAGSLLRLFQGGLCFHRGDCSSIFRGSALRSRSRW